MNFDSNSDSTNKAVTVNYSSGVIKTDENMCSDEYDLIYWAYFIPNGFNNKIVRIIGEAGFDPECEKNDFEFEYFTEPDLVVYNSKYYRTTVVSEEQFNTYKDNVVYEDKETGSFSASNSLSASEDNIYSLPWIRYPRTKDGVLIPLLVEKIFGRIPSKIVFKSNK